MSLNLKKKLFLSYKFMKNVSHLKFKDAIIHFLTLYSISKFDIISHNLDLNVREDCLFQNLMLRCHIQSSKMSLHNF